MMDWGSHALFANSLHDLLDQFATVAHYKKDDRVTKQVETAYACFTSVPLSSCSEVFQAQMNKVFQAMRQKAQRMKQNSRQNPMLQLLLLPMLKCISSVRNKTQGDKKLNKLYGQQIQYVTHKKEVIEFLQQKVARVQQTVDDLPGVVYDDKYTIVAHARDLLGKDNHLLNVGFKS